MKHRGGEASGGKEADDRLTLEHTAKICRQAYPPGKHFAVPPLPDVESVNKRGDYAIEADRLAFIDGDRDPWRVMVSSIKHPYLVDGNAEGSRLRRAIWHREDPRLSISRFILYSVSNDAAILRHHRHSLTRYRWCPPL